MSLLWKRRLLITKPPSTPSLSRSIVRWVHTPDLEMPPSSLPRRPRARSRPRSEDVAGDTELARRVLDTALEYLKAGVAETRQPKGGEFSAMIMNILEKEESSSNWQKGLRRMLDELPNIPQNQYGNLD
jgi:hypothetical protein